MTQSKITYVEGDLFTAPSGTILVHACNTVGTWGAGIALTFRSKYPRQFEEYQAHCKSCSASSEELLGTCLLLEDPGSGHSIACLFTSKMYGKRKDKEDSILAKTREAVVDLVKQNSVDQRALHACRFNSGKFGVAWEKTADILNDLDVEMTVYQPLE